MPASADAVCSLWRDRDIERDSRQAGADEVDGKCQWRAAHCSHDCGRGEEKNSRRERKRLTDIRDHAAYRTCRKPEAMAKGDNDLYPLPVWKSRMAMSSISGSLMVCDPFAIPST